MMSDEQIPCSGFVCLVRLMAGSAEVQRTELLRDGMMQKIVHLLIIPLGPSA